MVFMGRTAGIHSNIVLDRGLENRGQLQKLMTSRGVLLRYMGVESPYQRGRGETHGGIPKEVIKALQPGNYEDAKTWSLQ